MVKERKKERKKGRKKEGKRTVAVYSKQYTHLIPYSQCLSSPKPNKKESDNNAASVWGEEK